jgi:ribosomal protein S18 acetylase RimI-like enzyme
MLTVRRGRPGDELAMAGVHVRAWQVAYRGIVPDDVLDAMDVEDRAARYDDDIFTRDDRPFWLADRDGIVVGFCGVGTSRDVDGEGELYSIYVDPGEWGSGAGTMLMDEALSFLRPRYDTATLWVLRDNPRARRFYEKHGWFFDGTEKADERPSFVLHEVRYRITLA